MTSDEIVSTRPVDAISSTYGEGAMSRQTLGGVALWARERFSSSAYISYNPTSDTDLQEPKGTLLHDFAEAEFVNRSTTWADPTDYILNGIREVMFRSAIEFNDNLQPVKVTAENILDVLEYKTNMLFLALGVAASVIGCLGVLPLMWGFWRLDEDVNLNPSRCADAVLAVSEEKQAGVDGTQVTVGDGEKAVTYTAVDSKHQ